MDLSFLDKSSTVTPLLVKLYDGHKIYELAKDHKPLARSELTTAVIELLEMDLSPRESELVADVLIALTRQAELELKQALADHLSVMDNVPLRLILQLANDEIDVAGAILRNSPVLGTLDLLYIIKGKSAAYWREIAMRQHLDDQVINTLADTKDVSTALALAENDEITLTSHAVNVIAEMSQEHSDLAYPLLARHEVGSDVASTLYEFVGQELKRYILDNFELEQDLLLDAVDDILSEYEEIAEDQEFEPTASVMKATERFQSKGLLTTKLMLNTLKRGQLQSFVAQFSKFSNLDVSTTIEIIRQPNGQALAVVCKAMDIVKSDFVSIFLLTNSIRSDAGQMVETKDMAKALRYYDRIEKSVALDIMKNSLTDLGA